MSGMAIHDTLSGQMVDLADASRERAAEPLVWYSCGPTVYDAAHLGHARTYVSLDVLKRAATSFHGLPVRLLMGVTDVDDKIIERAGNGSPHELARQQEAAFFASLSSLGVAPPDSLLRVTEHIGDIVSCVAELEAAGIAYRVPPEAAGEDRAGVYFSVGALESQGGSYGRLRPAAAALSESPAANDASGSGWKRDPRDFALWKAATGGEPSWPSPWGEGRPGWHIECSAMTLAAAGERLDLHAGGSDLCFPHHVNEMAQSEAILAARRAASATSASGAGDAPAWVRAWCHPGPLTIRGLKMSKSLKNFVTVDALLASCRPDAATRLSAAVAGLPPGDVFRLFCLRHPYRSPVAFSEDSLASAAAELRRWARFLDEAAAASAAAWAGAPTASVRAGPDADALSAEAAALRPAVSQALGNDLDTPRAMRRVGGVVDSGLACLRGASGAASSLALASAVTAVASVLRDLGFAFAGPHAAWSGPVAGAAAATPLRAVSGGGGAGHGDVLAGFRIAVRAAARGHGGAAAVLRVCDALRDDVGPRMAPDVDLRDGLRPSPGAAAAQEALEAAAGASGSTAGHPRGMTPPASPAGGGEPGLAHPLELYRDDARFGEVDGRGIPLSTAAGEALSRSQRNKLISRQKKHANKWSRGRPDDEIAEVLGIMQGEPGAS